MSLINTTTAVDLTGTFDWAAVDLTGSFDWAAVDLTGPFDWAFSSSSTSVENTQSTTSGNRTLQEVKQNTLFRVK